MYTTDYKTCILTGSMQQKHNDQPVFVIKCVVCGGKSNGKKTCSSACLSELRSKASTNRIKRKGHFWRA